MTAASVALENVEATEAWNGPLFDIWKSFQAVVVSNAKAHGDAALADHHPEPGDRVLDIGCGLGDSTLQLARLADRTDTPTASTWPSGWWRARGRRPLRQASTT